MGNKNTKKGSKSSRSEGVADSNTKNILSRPEDNPAENKETTSIDIEIESENSIDNIEKNVNEVPTEKLRRILRIFKYFIEDEEGKSSEIFLDKFFGLIDGHFSQVYEEFEKMNQSSKPLIKLLQIFDLIAEKYKEPKKEIFERIYKMLVEKKMLINDRRFLRKRIEKTKRALIWKNETEGVKYAKEMINFISTLSEEALFKFLLMGRFDKEKTGIKDSFSLIVGDEGGLFLLINKVPPGSRQEKFILDSGVSEEFLREKREANNKVILGKGSFGKVRLAVSITGSFKVDIGQLVCVKKTLEIGAVKKGKNGEIIETVDLNKIADSTFEDFFARKLNESIHTPMPLDMAILNNDLNNRKHMKGYLFMELVPENTAEKIFREEKYKKWEYLKPYMLAVMKTTNDLLLKERVFNSDLKPQNTLFDPLSRKMAIIDLGSSIIINRNQDLTKFDASTGGFGTSEPYCPPEINDENQLEKLNLLKAISYLCGITMIEVTCGFAAARNAKKGDWKITAENNDLDEESKKTFIMTLKQLTEINPLNRLDLGIAIANIEKIGLNADEIMKKATSEQYIEKVRKLLKENNPSVLSLNEDINETRKKGVIKQLTVESNPKIFKHQKTQEANKELDSFINDNMKGNNEKLLVLLGEAGSGKSLAFQLRFVKEIEEWEYGKKALPLFFNMADEVDLEKVISRLNAILGCNLKLDVPNSDEIHLFIDSYDEGCPEKITNSLEQEGKNENNKQAGDKVSIIEQYFEKLSKWKRCKILVSCRTDFVLREGEDNLSEFKVKNTSLRVRYIAPIDYEKPKEKENEEKDIYINVWEWLKRENINENPEEIIKILKRLDVEGRMRTGLMFNMIMKMVVKMQNENLNELRLKGFEIYRRTIQEEFRINWEKFVHGRGSDDQGSDNGKEKYKAIKEEIQKIMKDDYKVDEKIDKENDFEVIWEGMERIGELLAAEMSLKKSNRLKYSEVEKLLRRTGKTKNSSDDDYDLNERTEWKTLYHILRIMGLKLERKKVIYSMEVDENEETHGLNSNINNIDENDIIINIGFRHETYKNYYLLRGLKRLLPIFLKEMMNGKNSSDSTIPPSEEDESKRMVIAALLEEERVISNYELLRFCGEEIQNYKDPSLREGLRKLLDLVQTRNRESGSNTKSERISRSAAVIMSLLVAGRYQFWEEDLSDIDLSGAYLRGGVFCRSKFDRTNLRNANMSHANFSEASFFKADLRNLQLGVWPDLIGDDEEVYSVSFSPDDKRIASGTQGNSIKIWDSLSGECLKTLAGHSRAVDSVCFSLEGNYLASGSRDNLVKIWNSVSGDCLKTLAGHSKIVNSVCFSPDGKRISSGSDDSSVKIWDCVSGQCLKTLSGHFDSVRSVCYSSDGMMVASGSYDNLVKIWDCASGKCTLTLEGHSDTVNSVSYRPDGKAVMSGSYDLSVRIWDTTSGECLQTLVGHSGPVNSVYFSPDGRRLASAGSENSVKIWDSTSGECVQTLAGHSRAVNSVCFSLDGRRIASGSSDKSVKIYDTTNEECVQALAGHSKAVKAVSFSPDGKKIASGSDDNSVKIWDPSSGECRQTIKGHSGLVRSLCFSPEGERLASGSSDCSVKIWDSTNGECRRTLVGHSGWVKSVCFSPDGRLIASASDDHSVKLWDSASGECVQTLAKHSQSVNSVCFSPDGKRFACGNDDNSVEIWDTASGECLQILTGHSDRVISVFFSLDGERLASGSGDNTVKIWDNATGQCLQTLVGHHGAVNSVCMSSDGKIIATGADDNSVKIWNSASGECLQTLAGHSRAVNSVCLSPEGTLATSSSNDNSLKIWDSASKGCAGIMKGTKEETNFFGGDKKFLMRMTLSAVEDSFRCDSCELSNCKMEGGSEVDMRNKKVILQRGGKICNE